MKRKRKKKEKKVIYENDLVAYNTKQDGNRQHRQHRQHRQNRQAKPGYDEYKHPEIEKKSFPGLTRLGPSKPPLPFSTGLSFNDFLEHAPEVWEMNTQKYK